MLPGGGESWEVRLPAGLLTLTLYYSPYMAEVIRGGGYVWDLLQRWDTRTNTATVQYVKDMGLNTIRQEGKLGTLKAGAFDSFGSPR